MTTSGIEPATFGFVIQHLNHCATAVPYIRLILLVNTQNISANKIVDSSTIQRAETKYGLRIKFLALLVMIQEVWLNA